MFELLQITPGCPYRFESPVVKESEQRLDGLLEPTEPGYPYYFLEVQGYLDKGIYWRGVHQVGLFFHQRPKLQGSDWRLVVLFLDATFDPTLKTLGPLHQETMPWLIRGIIPDLLQHVTKPSPVLNVLRPLIAQNERDVYQQGTKWTQEIQQMPQLVRSEQERLLNLLVQFLLQKFSHLDRKEIGRMLQLKPIEESVAVQEWMQEAQVILLAGMIEQKFSVAKEDVMQRLAPLDSKALQALGRYVMTADRYDQIEGWIDGHLATIR